MILFGYHEKALANGISVWKAVAQIIYLASAVVGRRCSRRGGVLSYLEHVRSLADSDVV